jgi:hypothetical protein
MNKKFLIFGILGIVLSVFVLSNVFSETNFATVNSAGIVFTDPTINQNLCQVAGCTTNVKSMPLSQVSTVYAVNSAVYNSMKIGNSVSSFLSSGASVSQNVLISTSAEVYSGKIIFPQGLFNIGKFASQSLNESDIYVSGIDFTKESNQSVIDFHNEASLISIFGANFTNIVSGNLILDLTGSVIFANFTTGTKSADYIFGNTKTYVPKNSHVLYVDGTIIISAPSGSVFESLPSVLDPKKFFSVTTIEGNNIKLPNGATLDSGKLNYQFGKYFVSPGDKAVVNGVDVSSGEGIDMYFDGKNHAGNYVSIGSDRVVYATKDALYKTSINFTSGNKFFNQPVWMQLKGENSSLVVNKKGKYESYPEVVSTSPFELKTGELNFQQRENQRMYFYPTDTGAKSAEMTIVSTGEKIVSIGPDSNFYAHLVRNATAIDYGNLKYFRKQLESGVVDRNEVFNPGTYVDRINHNQRVYLKGAQDILLKKLIQKYPQMSDAVDHFKGLGNTQLISESSTSKYNKYYLTPDEIQATLKGTPYQDYWKVLEANRDLHLSFSTKGSVEAAASVNQENFGLRQAFFKY